MCHGLSNNWFNLLKDFLNSSFAIVFYRQVSDGQAYMKGNPVFDWVKSPSRRQLWVTNGQHAIQAYGSIASAYSATMLACFSQCMLVNLHRKFHVVISVSLYEYF